MAECCCGGDFVVLQIQMVKYLLLCQYGGVFVVVLIWRCICSGAYTVMYWQWCLYGGVVAFAPRVVCEY